MKISPAVRLKLLAYHLIVIACGVNIWVAVRIYSPEFRYESLTIGLISLIIIAIFTRSLFKSLERKDR